MNNFTGGAFVSADEQADVVVIVVTYNSAHDVPLLIESLRAEAAEQRIRVVVADNASNDDTLAVAGAHPDVIALSTGGNIGYAGGLNAVSRYYESADSILVLNPDARVTPGSLAALRARLFSTGAGIVVPRIIDSSGTDYPSLRREPTVLRSLGDAVLGRLLSGRASWLSEVVRRPEQYAFAHTVDWASGAALLIDSQVARRVGAWDERFFLYSEETDFQRRVRDAGYEIWYEPHAVVEHDERGSGFSLQLDKLIAVNRVRYARLHMSRIGAALYRSTVALHHLIRARKHSYREIFKTVLRERTWAALPHAHRNSARMRVLLVAPAADGNDIGEAWNAFQWARLLSVETDLTVLATFKRGHAPLSQQLPSAHVVEWAEPPFLGRFERFNSLLQPGYFPFKIRARRWVKKRMRDGERFDLAIQVVPVALRYPSPLAGLGIPFIMGPVGGSLKSPSEFVAEEGATPWYQRLRVFDGLRLRFDPGLRHTYESADCVLTIAPYVHNSLHRLNIRRMEIMSEVALLDVQPHIDRTHRDGPVRLLHVGRTIRTKGLRDLIRAMGELKDLPVVLDVLGEGNDAEECRRLVEELELGERVIFHGHVPRSVVDEFYQNADVFAFPSYREPGGGVIMEAMSFGLPLVLCENGGPAAFVTPDCAILLPPVSPAQLARDCAAALRLLIEDAPLRRMMGDAARAHARDTHLWTARIEQMKAIGEELLTSAG